MSTKPTTPSRRRATTSTTRVKDAWDTRFPTRPFDADWTVETDPRFVALQTKVTDLQATIKAMDAWRWEIADAIYGKAWSAGKTRGEILGRAESVKEVYDKATDINGPYLKPLRDLAAKVKRQAATIRRLRADVAHAEQCRTPPSQRDAG